MSIVYKQVTIIMSLKAIEKKCDRILSCMERPSFQEEKGGLSLSDLSKYTKMVPDEAVSDLLESGLSKILPDKYKGLLPVKYGVRKAREYLGVGLKRKPTAYQKYMKAELKKMKKAHPRMSQQDLFRAVAASWSSQRKKSPSKNLLGKKQGKGKKKGGLIIGG